jgi:hypothetical protein
MSRFWLVGVLVAAIASTVVDRAAAQTRDVPTDDAVQQQRFQDFESLLTGAKLVGYFTVVGQDDKPLARDEYIIDSVKKAEEGDYWVFNTRFKFGGANFKLPLPLQVKWAGDTPVITLTDLTIPTLGTFSSRVAFYNKKYAGTWTHGKVGGHMFGVVEKLDDESEPATGDEGV